MGVQVIGSPRVKPPCFAHPLHCVAGRLAPFAVSPLIPSAPLAAGAPPLFLLPEKQPPWQPAVILETHMEKSS